MELIFVLGTTFCSIFNQIGLPALSLNRDYLIEGIEGRKVKLNYENSVDIAVMFGADRTCAERELKDALDFEVALANVSYTAFYYLTFNS